MSNRSGAAKHRRVAVGRAGHEEDDVARGHYRLADGIRRHHVRATMFTELSKRSISSTAPGHQLAGSARKLCQRFWVAQQRQQAVAEQVGRGLVAGHEQQNQVAQQLVLAQRAPSLAS
jgi:hypothetical protein